MCGIAGFFCKDDLLKRNDLTVMGRALAHRGPDAEGFFMHGHAGLVHRRLSIIDLSTAANQPMVSHNGRYIMVYNGEVYNFPELRSELEKQGIHNFRSHSDSEVILETFVTNGVEFVKQLNGMFATAIYDKEEKKLFLFRDHTGIKPLFVFWDGTDLAFASELKALLALPALRTRVSLNQSSLSDFLHLGYIPEPATAYKNIQKFPAGCYAVYDGNEYRLTPYWEPHEQFLPETCSDEEQAAKELEELLISSVKMRLVSDVPFGTFLSGGVDSSLVTAIAQKVSSEKIKTFTIGFRESSHDESPYARAIAKHLGTDHHEFIVTDQDARELLPEMMALYDEPFADSSAIPTMLLSKLARQHVTMTLSGDGGDELFMGYGAHRWAQRFAQTKWKFISKSASEVLKFGNNRHRRIAEMLKYGGQNLPSHIFSQEQYLFSAAEVRKILCEPNDFAGFAFEPGNIPRRLMPEETQSFFDLTHYLKDDLLVKVDRASMRYSLETRVPLLDNRIVEFALNLDASLKLHGHSGKYLLKKVLYKYLPETLFARPKWGFSIPLNLWLQGPLQRLADEFLSPEMIKKHQIVRPELVADLQKRFTKEANNYLYNRLWALIVLHHWLERKS